MCGATRIRTGDTRIFSPMLYLLSYGTNTHCVFASAKVALFFFSSKFLVLFLAFAKKKGCMLLCAFLLSDDLQECLRLVVDNQFFWKCCFLEQGQGVAVVADARGVVGVAAKDDGAVVLLAEFKHLYKKGVGEMLASLGIE